jgi:hypothetical protein
MPNESATIVQKLWNFCNVLQDDGVSYGDLETALAQFQNIHTELGENG